MSTSGAIRILHLEDSPEDAEIVHHRLRTGGIAADIVLVSDKQSFETALARDSFDLILSDYDLPGYSGMAAVRLAQERHAKTPVIVISGTVGEEEAVNTLHIGATDYLLKHRLDRLVPAVRRALQHAEERKAREAAEAKLKATEYRFRQFADQSSECFWIVSPDSESLIYLSPAVETIWGISQETFYQNPRAWLDSIYTDDQPAVQEAWTACVEGRRPAFEMEYRIIQPDGSMRWVKGKGALIYDVQGNAVTISGMASDITDRKNADAERWRNEERLRISQQAARWGLFEYTFATGENHWTPELQALWGLASGEFAGTADAWRDRIHPDDRVEVRRQEERSLITGEYLGEYRIVWPDGSVRWMYARGQVYRDDQGRPERLLGINLDITERKQLETQFRQAQKMESVGQLAGGIAHDFNNLITIINGTAELAGQGLDDGHPLREDLQQIRQAGDSAAALTRQLLAFSRKQILQPQVLDLRQQVSQIDSMLRRLIGEDIELVLALGERGEHVYADPGQLEQVILNLAVNARDAMPEGGRLTLEIESLVLDERYGHEHGLELTPGRYVRLTVSDTGVGMDEATRRRIFEPFFTTKELGKGTGLGLSTVYGIVKQSGGFVWVYSEVGRGTSFRVYFPAVTAASEQPRPSSPVLSTRGTETVLVVEDVEGLRKLTARVLAREGYTVLTAGTGDDAIATLENHGAPVQLMITDVVMPGMSGRVLADRFKDRHPGMKVLYMSGYTDDFVMRHGVLTDDMPFLSKPFSTPQLTRKVREVLDSKENAKREASHPHPSSGR